MTRKSKNARRKARLAQDPDETLVQEALQSATGTVQAHTGVQTRAQARALNPSPVIDQDQDHDEIRQVMQDPSTCQPQTQPKAESKGKLKKKSKAKSKAQSTDQALSQPDTIPPIGNSPVSECRPDPALIPSSSQSPSATVEEEAGVTHGQIVTLSSTFEMQPVLTHAHPLKHHMNDLFRIWGISFIVTVFTTALRVLFFAWWRSGRISHDLLHYERIATLEFFEESLRCALIALTLCIVKLLLVCFTRQGSMTSTQSDLTRAQTLEFMRQDQERLAYLESHLLSLSDDMHKLNGSHMILRNANHELLQSQSRDATTIRELRRKDTTAVAALHGAELRFKALENTIAELNHRVKKAQEAKDELQFELELAKCVPEISETCIQPTFPPNDFATPFALVLVDGDAYRWSFRHFEGRVQRTAGAEAASAIRMEVRNYLLANKERLPLHSKIVTRVFQNFSGRSSRSQAGLLEVGKGLDEFSRSFTETYPLFDYLDCGRGKERADSKIQENFHLFISNPLCHTLFLAAATDNGFARLLEQYAGDQMARDKIVLVHPGYIISQIAELGFKDVQWPLVFQRRSMPASALGKEKHEKCKCEKLRQATEISTTLEVFRDLTTSLEPWKELPKRGGLRIGAVSYSPVTTPYIADAQQETMLYDDFAEDID